MGGGRGRGRVVGGLCLRRGAGGPPMHGDFRTHRLPSSDLYSQQSAIVTLSQDRNVPAHRQDPVLCRPQTRPWWASLTFRSSQPHSLTTS